MPCSGADDAARRLRPLTADAAALALGEPAPDAELLSVLQCELQALTTHDAPTADLLRLARRRATLGEEQVGVDTEAVGVVLPVLAEVGSTGFEPARVVAWIARVAKSIT